MVASGVEDERVRREVGEEEEDEVFLVPCVHYNFHGKVRPEDDVVILQSECHRHRSRQCPVCSLQNPCHGAQKTMCFCCN
jgi:hypothetical protein